MKMNEDEKREILHLFKFLAKIFEQASEQIDEFVNKLDQNDKKNM